MTTKGIMIDRIMKKVEGGTQTTRSRTSRAEVAQELNSVLAKLLKAQVLDGFKEGMSTADGMVYTYENIPIDRRDNGRCSAKLPVTPMNLPGGIGVYAVYPAGYPEKAFIPVSTGLLYTVTNNKILSPIGRKIYTYSNGRVNINADVIGAGVTHLDMELCCVDINSLSDFDPLPVPADIETEAVLAVLQLLGLESPVTRADDKTASPTKTDVS